MTKHDSKQKSPRRQPSIKKVNPQEPTITGQSPQTGKIERPDCGPNRIPVDSLVECGTNIETLQLADIIDVTALQSLMVDFYELTHVPMAIIDMNGKVLVGIGWQQICTEFHRVNPTSCRYCIESDLELTSGIDESEFKLYKCKNNMWDAAAPLIVAGRKMGNIFTGQFFFDDETPDYELFRAQAKKYGFDEEAYMAALQKVNRLSRGQFKQGMNFLHGIAKMISQTGYANLQLSRLLEQQKQTQEALRQSEQQFHSMFERHQAIKLVIDPETGAITDANEAASRFYGYSRQQLCTMSIGQINQLPKKEIESERRKAISEQRNYFIFPHRLADGTVRIVEVYSSPVNIGGKILLYSIIHDITERREAEEQIQKAAARFEILSDSASKLLESQHPQQVIDSLCRRVMELLDCHIFVNYLVDESAGRLHLNASGGLPEEMARAIEWLDFGSAICGRVAQQGKRIVAENIQESCDDRADLVRSVGIRAYACHPILAQGKVVGTVSFGTRSRECFSDEDLETMKTVTDQVATAIERKLSEEALRQSQLDFGRAQAVGSIGSWRLDVRKNKLTWSDESYRIFGIAKGTPLTYETFLSTIHPDDRAYVDAKWKAGLAGAEYDIEHRIISEGRIKWVREKAYLEFDNRGELTGGFGITQDITYRKQIEEDLRKLNETLEQRVTQRTLEVQNQADRLRALASQLSKTEQRERKRLSKILHDHIQQLLVAAKMQLGWLKNDHDPNRCLTIVQGVDAIIKETLDASRSLSVDLSPPILQEAGLIGGLSWLASRMRDKNGFTVHLSADNTAEPAAEEVRFLLFECARELLLNALKHSGVSEAQVTLKKLDDNNIQLTVCDEGRGFEADKLNNRPLDEITFGLFSIRERLAHIGGQMQIQTDCGRGARFTLTVAEGFAEKIMSVQSCDQEGRQNVSPSSESRLPMCRILVCDDHKIVREGLVKLLQFQSGLEVVGQAQDGEQAIEMARNLSPDIIIMDVNLGRISGIEATRRILAADSSIKIIGLSMHEDCDVANAMRSAGAIAYLTKTGPSEELIATVKACVNQKPAD